MPGRSKDGDVPKHLWYIYGEAATHMQDSQQPLTGQRTKFTNPPITELVIALFHLPLEELKAQHIGIYWDRIRNKYPLCEQRAPIQLPDTPPTLSQAPGEVFPLPRFWFHNTTHPTLIQVQRNAFVLNWRLLPALPNIEYPHYETVAEDFWQEFDNYQTFVQEYVGGKLDPIQRCELTYVNMITPNELFSSTAEARRVLPPLSSLYDIQADDRMVAGMIGTVTYRVNPTTAYWQRPLTPTPAVRSRRSSGWSPRGICSWRESRYDALGAHPDRHAARPGCGAVAMPSTSSNRCRARCREQGRGALCTARFKNDSDMLPIFRRSLSSIP
jgi:uncharacterized protein (TIGR04255 family)